VVGWCIGGAVVLVLVLGLGYAKVSKKLCFKEGEGGEAEGRALFKTQIKTESPK